VKIIFQPEYLTGTDGLLDLTYYEAMVGGQLGIYPSYYEPWGYTPLETAAYGVPAITTDLAGYGRWVLKKTDQTKKAGVQVLKRYQRSDEQAEEELAAMLLDYALMSKRQRMEIKLDSKRIADMADWKTLIANYIDAHNSALAKHQK
jgi:glycosyltransferase involved in cell wall biosynthesis